MFGSRKVIKNIIGSGRIKRDCKSKNKTKSDDIVPGEKAMMWDYGLNKLYGVTIKKKQGDKAVVTHPSGEGELIVDKDDLILKKGHRFL